MCGGGKLIGIPLSGAATCRSWRALTVGDPARAKELAKEFNAASGGAGTLPSAAFWLAMMPAQATQSMAWGLQPSPGLL